MKARFSDTALFTSYCQQRWAGELVRERALTLSELYSWLLTLPSKHPGYEEESINGFDDKG